MMFNTLLTIYQVLSLVALTPHECHLFAKLFNGYYSLPFYYISSKKKKKKN